MKSLSELKVKIFADGADLNDMINIYKKGFIKGFTTNPTLMKKSGVKDYEGFAKEVLKEIKDLPISFEVFSDDFESMEKQAKKIATWGDNVNIKIPITNTKGKSSIPLIKRLSSDDISLNITAVFTLDQVKGVAEVLSSQSNNIISVFAGRIADTGMDPIPHMKECKEILKSHNNAELLWASPRELLNIYHAEESGCDIITVLNSILEKLNFIGKDLSDFSLDTVKMFYNDAQQAGYKII